MSDSSPGSPVGGTSRWLRRLLTVALAIGTVAAARQLAISRSDKEFERRMLEADRLRN
jgi:hypothetical protein